jgi:hypothetical protein
MAASSPPPDKHSFFTRVPMAASLPPPDEHYIFIRVISNTTKHVCLMLACRKTNMYIKG